MRRVLVTGATGGIGQALVRRFSDAGFEVLATDRSTLDVTSAESVARARLAFGVPDVVVNNAGVGLLGPMAEVSDEVLTHLFDVNVRGLARVTRAFVPDMCRRGRGRVINVGSLAGVVTLPWFGAYAATKHAVEAISDALRLECAPFGVAVSVIEPTIVGTGFVDAAVQSLERAAAGSLWRDALLEGVRQRATLVAGQVTPDDVARAALDAATARRPRPRYRVGVASSLLARLAALLPSRLNDVVLRRLTGLRSPSNPPQELRA